MLISKIPAFAAKKIEQFCGERKVKNRFIVLKVHRNSVELKPKYAAIFNANLVLRKLWQSALETANHFLGFFKGLLLHGIFYNFYCRLR